MGKLAHQREQETELNVLDSVNRSYEFNRAAFFELSSKAEGKSETLWLETRSGKEPIYTHYRGPEKPKNLIIHISGACGLEYGLGAAVQQDILASNPRLPERTGYFLIDCLDPNGARLGSLAIHKEESLSNSSFKESYLTANRHFDIFKKIFKPETEGNLNYSNEIIDLLFSSNENLGLLVNRVQEYLLTRHSDLSKELIELFDQFYQDRSQIIEVFKEVSGISTQSQNGKLDRYCKSQGLEVAIDLASLFKKSSFSEVETVVIIDVHSGLGDLGSSSSLVQFTGTGWKKEVVDQLIPNTIAHSAIAHSTIVQSEGNLLYSQIFKLFKNADTIAVQQKFGTTNLKELFKALISDNYYCKYGVNGSVSNAKAALGSRFDPSNCNLRKEFLISGTELFSKTLAFIASIDPDETLYCFQVDPQEFL